MDALPPALQPLEAYPQFILYKLTQSKTRPGKMDKIPIDYRTGIAVNPHTPTSWTDSKTALIEAKRLGPAYGIGFVFTKNTPFFFLDVDDCLDTTTNTWTPLAMQILQKFSGAAVEISVSCRGFHIFGRGQLPDHISKNSKMKIELYDSGRFVALTGIQAQGDANKECPDAIKWIVDEFLTKTDQPITNNTQWTNEPCENWNGPIDDPTLISLALESKSARAIFGDGITFADLWHCKEEALIKAYPDPSRSCGYDQSAADFAIALHFAFWTGKNCDRIISLMFQSELVRDKWNRQDYMQRTILKACQTVKGVYTAKKTPEKPEPLPELPKVMPFDQSYLPGTLRDYVLDIADRMQCPADFPAIATLTMIAAIIGRQIGIRPKRADTWTVVPNLWAIAIGNSGVMKSPALKEALSPLAKLEAEAYRKFDYEMKDHEIEDKLNKLKVAQKISSAKQALVKKIHDSEIKSLLDGESLIEKPILKRYTTNNSSYEALGELLIENPNGILVTSDELIGLLKQLDASGQEAARAFYLTGADGDKTYTFDRIQRGKGLHIEAVCISIIGTIQPGVLADHVRQAVNSESGADGLLQRFGMAVYPDVSPHWKDIDRPPNIAARKIVTELVERLVNLSPIGIGAELDPYGGIPFLRFDNDAQIAFSKWRSELEHRLRSEDDHPAIVSHLSKYRKLVPTLALIMHLCDNTQGRISVESLQRAVFFSNYLESHARRIYSFATAPDIDAAKILLKHLQRKKLSSPFTAREVYRPGWTGLSSANKAKTAIDVLIEYRHLTEENLPTGGREKVLYHWNKP